MLILLTCAILCACSSHEGSSHTPRDSAPDATPPSFDSGDRIDASDAADTDTAPADDIPTYELTPEPYTTLQGMWAPVPLPEEATQAFLDGELTITDVDRYDEYGIGVEWVEGQPWVEHDELAPNFEKEGGGERRSLLYFWESADPQLIDEESPIRFEGTVVAPFGSTYRPQSHVVPQIYESQVRSARRISEESGRPFEFAFIAGDLTDGGQKNELDWATEILAGGVIHPDSGIEDDPVPGPGNDFTDPFMSAGIGVPWYPAIGNHETLYMGILPATDTIQEAAVGDEVIDFTDEIVLLRNIDGASNGFRDASTETAQVVTEGHTPPDPDRRILDLEQVIDALRGAGGEPEGHGLSQESVEEKRAYYSFYPIAGKPIRFIVLDTVLHSIETGMGGMGREQYNWLQTELKRADQKGELVIVGSHHRTSDFAPLSIVGGGELEELLTSYDNVVLHVSGHGHKNTKELVQPDPENAPERGHWEIMCSSTVDFPMQSRIIELVWEGDEHLSVYVTNLEQNAADGTMAREALDLAAGRRLYTYDDYRGTWESEREKMNLLLRFELPDDVVENLAKEEWPTRVESVETLEAFDGP